MKFYNEEIKVRTEKTYHFINLTDQVKEAVKKSGIKNGLINVQTLHTTTAIVVNEDEPLLLQDIERHLERFAEQGLSYYHDNFDIRTKNMCDGECANGHAHCKAVILPTNATINLINEEMQLGQWQQVFALELDRSRDRKIQIHIIGE